MQIKQWRRWAAPMLILLAGLLAENCTDATSRPAAPVVPAPAVLRDPKIRTLLADYDRYFTEAMRLSNTPGAAVVIVKDSMVLFQRGYGLRANGRPDSVDANTVFRIGSLSKGFAGVLTGMLVREGKLHWEDPIVSYVPEFALSSAEQTQQVQLRHLLSHTTGLPYHAYTNLIEAGYNLRAIATQFARLPLHGKPGEVFSYQNAVFSLVGEAMQQVTGKRYADLLRDKILQPAGMRTASADWASIHRNTNIALPHNATRSGWWPDSITTRYYNAAPAGGVNASAADMGQWLLLLLGHRPDIVSPATLEEVFHPVVRTYNERRYFRDWPGSREAYYAMGWRVLVNGADTILYHGGAVNNFRGEIGFDRRTGIGICVLFNASTPLASACIPAFFERYRNLKQ